MIDSDKTNPKLALSREQAAAAIGISPRKFDELVKDREAKLPRLRIGSRLLFPVDGLRQWLVEQSESETRRACR